MFRFMLRLGGIALLSACTITHKIEPSDKPIKVQMDLNVKIQDDNQDFLNLEEEVLKKEEKKK